MKMKFLTKLGLPKTNLIMDGTHKIIQGLFLIQFF